MLTAAILVIAKVLVWNFASSFLACLFLIGVNLFTGGRVTSISLMADDVIGGISYLVVVAAVILALKRALNTVFETGMQNWYFMLSKLLFCIVILVEDGNIGAEEATGSKQISVSL